jgi:phosphoglycolate phosphatase-like HAD superfamily hydrolase
MSMFLWRGTTAALAFAAALLTHAAASADGLPSWSDGNAKARIASFVEAVTDPDGPDYVTPAARIAVFDNDGTLWAERPVYFQFLFAVDALKARAAADPSILTSDALKAAATGDLKGALAGGEKGLLEIASASHSGMSVEAFQAEVRSWLAKSRHPVSGRPYTGMVYQPMLELLSYLRDNGFKTYIVSGGGVDFMRAFTEDTYGIPPEQVIGSMGKARYEVADGKPLIWKDPGIAFIDDKAGKPLAISRQIGRRPIFVAGNSDGDFQMLEWSTAGAGPRLGIIVHHTDAKREWAYDRESHIGRLERGLDEGPGRGWVIVDMARDWARIYSAAQ